MQALGRARNAAELNDREEGLNFIDIHSFQSWFSRPLAEKQLIELQVNAGLWRALKDGAQLFRAPYPIGGLPS
jgi:hypothetical protein